MCIRPVGISAPSCKQSARSRPVPYSSSCPFSSMAAVNRLGSASSLESANVKSFPNESQGPASTGQNVDEGQEKEILVSEAIVPMGQIIASPARKQLVSESPGPRRPKSQAQPEMDGGRMRLILCYFLCGPPMPCFEMVMMGNRTCPRWACKPCNNGRRALEASRVVRCMCVYCQTFVLFRIGLFCISLVSKAFGNTRVSVVFLKSGDGQKNKGHQRCIDSLEALGSRGLESQSPCHADPNGPRATRFGRPS